MKKILCITYRDWANKIYDRLENIFPEYDFKIVRSREEYKTQNHIEDFKPDIILWYGWSWIIPEDLVDRYDCICLHPSPLPKYRGGSPIQNQIINNEKVSAVSIFKMNKGIDDGDIIRQLPMSLDGNISDIFNRMTDLGVSATCDFIKNGFNLQKQNHNEMTYYKRRKEEDSEITLQELENESAVYLYNKIRMLTDPYPNAYIVDKDGNKIYIKNAYIEKDQM